jgi:hypothetical protein
VTGSAGRQVGKTERPRDSHGRRNAAVGTLESEIGANERTPTAGVVTRSNGHVNTPSPSGVVPAGIRVAGPVTSEPRASRTQDRLAVEKLAEAIS